VKVVAVIDIGTNSIRLGVHQINAGQEQTRLVAHKEVVRLGQGEFAHNRISRDAMDRGLSVVCNFADIARYYGADEIIAVATAAVREARNRREFVDRAKLDCGVDIRVVSGMEEARLIYLGVVSGVELGQSRALIVDIGGGTAELAIGDAMDYRYLESVKLGAIRLADMFLRGESGPISKKRYRVLLDYVRGAAGTVFRKVRDHGFDVAYGSSGTIMNLAEVTARRLGNDITSIRNYRLSYSDLAETISMLCGLSLAERRNVPGINPERADIIISGAAVLDTIMRDTGAESITVSDRALRDGVLVDFLFQEQSAKQEYLQTSPRLRSVLELCKSCQFDEAHALKTAELADSIFVQLRDLGLHAYGKAETELLHYACLAHDVGTFVSASDHHKHSYYIIRNWNLLGFSDEEIEILATTAMCHRKAGPRKTSPRLGSAVLRRVEVMASVLRVADALDRTQLGVVQSVECEYEPSKSKLTLQVKASVDCPLEMGWLETKKQLFEEVLGVDVEARLAIADH
jgi:exopolyphosphatase/guanosine-5'-triphosphate,3'-diphosphate pyrophosphatase